MTRSPDSALNNWDADTATVAEELKRAAVGKQIRDIRLDGDESDRSSSSCTGTPLVIDFTDGTKLVIEPYDYEGYSSGVLIYREP